jgi:signal transduction histidine kinase
VNEYATSFPDGQDLRDNTLQTLYGIGLRLEYCLAMLDSAPDQARARLDGIIDTVGEVIDELRAHVHAKDSRWDTRCSRTM